MQELDTSGKSPADLFKCHACRLQIQDEYRLSVCGTTSNFHVDCLKCFSCRTNLREAFTCYERNNNHFCPSCYDRLFLAFKCARCQLKLTRRDLIFAVNDQCYHVGCFSCSQCGNALKQGDEYYVVEREAYCRAHMELPKRGSKPARSRPAKRNRSKSTTNSDGRPVTKRKDSTKSLVALVSSDAEADQPRASFPVVPVNPLSLLGSVTSHCHGNQMCSTGNRHPSLTAQHPSAKQR